MDQNVNSQLVEADARLATVFSHFYCVQQSATAPVVRRQLMPNYSMLLALNFGPSVPIVLDNARHCIEQTAILGPLQTVLHYELPPGADIIIVNFTLNGFYRLVSTFSTVAIADQQIHLNPEAFAPLWQQVAVQPTLANRLATIRHYLTTHLPPPDELTRWLLADLPYFEQVTIDPVKAMAQTHQVSTRHIQMRLKTNLGYTAKSLVRFLRFREVFTEVCAHPPESIDWATLVATHGYYDQSHLIRDFQYFVGITPRKFLQKLAQGEICISRQGA